MSLITDCDNDKLIKMFYPTIDEEIAENSRSRSLIYLPFHAFRLAFDVTFAIRITEAAKVLSRNFLKINGIIPDNHLLCATRRELFARGKSANFNYNHLDNC